MIVIMAALLVLEVDDEDCDVVELEGEEVEVGSVLESDEDIGLGRFTT